MKGSNCKIVPKKSVKQSTLPINERHEKKEFLLNRKTPEFVYEQPLNSLKHGTVKKAESIHFELFNDSKRILDLILNEYGSFDDYITQAYGKLLSYEGVQKKVAKYLQERNLANVVLITYVKNITCSAKLNSLGYERRLNKPECRKYNLLINIRRDNIFLRERGIDCLLDHEIGTHFTRAYNEGFQPWYWNRRRFRLSTPSSYEYKQIEEGLATINTMLATNVKYMGTPAMLYYATCMSHFLSFGQLFDHLSKYIHDTDYRWKHCVRIKKSLRNVNDFGGYAKDQCYFEGAYYLLANVKNIDFELLCRGKLTVRDLTRVRRLARNHIGQVPVFMQSIDKYIKQLTHIARINGISVLPCGDTKEGVKISASEVVVHQVSVHHHKTQCQDIKDFLHMRDSSKDSKHAMVLPKIAQSHQQS